MARGDGAPKLEARRLQWRHVAECVGGVTGEYDGAKIEEEDRLLASWIDYRVKDWKKLSRSKTSRDNMRERGEGTRGLYRRGPASRSEGPTIILGGGDV
jgi:hypothetical protein